MTRTLDLEREKQRNKNSDLIIEIEELKKENKGKDMMIFEMEDIIEQLKHQQKDQISHERKRIIS